MDASYEALRSLTSSRLRKDILGSLEEPMRLCDLRRAVSSNAPNTSSKARDLQEMGFICRDNGDYKRTRAGRLVHERLTVLSGTIESYYKHKEFWMRMLDHLPEEIQCSIHKFKGARLIRSGRDDIDRVKKEILKAIRGAEKELTVVLPVNCECIMKELEKASRTLDTRLTTLKDDPGLRYGMVKTNESTILFTDMLDMALILGKRS
jgi:predicted transcriptional regulator